MIFSQIMEYFQIKLFLKIFQLFIKKDVVSLGII